MATGGVFQPVYDSAKRPITAGGTVKTGPVVFMNTAEQAGLTNWHHTAGTPEKRFILEAKGPGVALLRFDLARCLSLRYERVVGPDDTIPLDRFRDWCVRPYR